MKTALIVAGIVFLVLAALAYGYTVTETDSYFGGLFSDQDTMAPYRAFAIPIALAGIVMLIVAATTGKKED